MTILSKLNISDKSKTPVFTSPEELLRNRILNSLETQIAAAKADAAGETIARIVLASVAAPC